MAVVDGSSLNPVAQRLDYLLRRARVVKQSTNIDPPLQVSELVPENESLLGDIEGEKEVRGLAIESAAKSVFYINLVGNFPRSGQVPFSQAQGSTRIDEPSFVTVWNLLDILQYCGDRGLYMYIPINLAFGNLRRQQTYVLRSWFCYSSKSF